MPDSHLLRSATPAQAPLELAVASARTLIEIRSWLPEHSSGQKPVILGDGELPGEVGATLAVPLHVLCVAPGEWLLIADSKSVASITQSEPTLARQGLVLTDVSDGLAILTVRGPAARDVLSKSCGLDLDPHVFAVGRCARTRLAQIAVIVECVDDSPSFDLYIPRSYLRYLTDWLEDAAVEFSNSQ